MKPENHTRIEKLILKAIEKAFGLDFKYFVIKPDEIVSNELGNYSQMFSFMPLDPKVEGSRLTGETLYIEILAEDMSGTGEAEISIVYGDGENMPLTYGALYSHLYWGQILVPEEF